MALSPILNLPVRTQVLGVDVESIAPVKGFTEDAFDVANVNGVLVVENPTDQQVRLVLPFPAEQSSAEVRIVSTGKRTEFRKRDGRAEQFVELLKSLGEIPADQEPILKEVRDMIRTRYDPRVSCRGRPNPGRTAGPALPRSTDPPARERRPALLRGRVLRSARRLHPGTRRTDPDERYRGLSAEVGSAQHEHRHASYYAAAGPARACPTAERADADRRAADLRVALA